MKQIPGSSHKKYFALAGYGLFNLVVILFLMTTANFAFEVISFIQMDLTERLASILSLLESFGF